MCSLPCTRAPAAPFLAAGCEAVIVPSEKWEHLRSGEGCTEWEQRKSAAVEGEVVWIGGTNPAEVNNPVWAEGHSGFWKYHQQGHKPHVLGPPTGYMPWHFVRRGILTPILWKIQFDKLKDWKTLIHCPKRVVQPGQISLAQINIIIFFGKDWNQKAGAWERQGNFQWTLTFICKAVFRKTIKSSGVSLLTFLHDPLLFFYLWIFQKKGQRSFKSSKKQLSQCSVEEEWPEITSWYFARQKNCRGSGIVWQIP